MPYTINGIGTSYYGKKAVESELGTCEFCRRQVELESYETGEYFVVLFIPLFPLGRKQIFDMCPACTKHRAVPVDKWHGIRDQTIQDSSRMLLMRPDDPEAGIKHLQNLTAFRQYNEARQLVPILERTHPDNVNVQLGIGFWLEKFGNVQDAQRCFDRAYELNPDHPAAIRVQARDLILKGNCPEAHQMLLPQQFPSPDFEPALFHALGNGFQTAGNHDQALEVYQQVLQASPLLMQDREFCRTVQRSEKALGRRESIIRRKPLYEYKAFWAAACVVLLFVGAMFLAHSRSQSRAVHVVNGLAQEITIRIDDGPELTVPRTGWVKARIPEGSHQVAIVSPPGLSERSFSFETSFREQIFSTPVFVLDPVGSAVVYHEKIVYSEDPQDDDPGNEFDYHVGQLLYKFNGIDFPFAPFPDEIEVDSTIHKTYRDRVDFEPLDPEQFLTGQLDASPEKQLFVTEQILTVAPDNGDFWVSYAGIAMSHNQLERCAEFVKPHLSVDPVNVKMHRFYQSVCGQIPDRSQALAADYDEYLSSDPDNADLIYLRGALLPVVSGSMVYMNAALDIDPEHVHSMKALAFDLNSTGDHSGAAELLARALQLEPDNEDLRDAYRNVLLASRDFRRLEHFTHDVPETWQQLTDTMNFLVKSKQFPRLEKLREDFVADSGDWGGVMFDIHDRYLKQKFDEIPGLVSELPLPRYQSLFGFYASIEIGDLEEARRHFNELEFQHDDFELLLAIALHHQGRVDASEQIREQFIISGQQKSQVENAFARLLRDCESRVIDIEEIRDLSIEPDRKRIYAIAIREFSKICDPDLDSEIRMLNYNYSFPYHFINNCLASETTLSGRSLSDANRHQADSVESSWNQSEPVSESVETVPGF
ncbi:MAG: hypothetical protein AAF456_04425 [Planctomycetota bacterium]